MEDRRQGLTRDEFYAKYPEKRIRNSRNSGQEQPTADTELNINDSPRRANGINTSSTQDLSRVVTPEAERSRNNQGQRPAPTPVPGLPPPMRRSGSFTVDPDLAEVEQAWDRDANSRRYSSQTRNFGGDNANRLVRIDSSGSDARRFSRFMDNQQQQNVLAAQEGRRRLLNAGVETRETPAQALQALTGQAIDDDLAARTRQFAEAMDLPVDKALSLAQRERQAGANPVNARRLMRGQPMVVPIPRKNVDFVGNTGEMTPDPLISDLVQRLNQRALKGARSDGSLAEQEGRSEANSGDWDSMERATGNPLTEGDMMVAALESRDATAGRSVRPFQALSAEQTAEQRDRLGSAKTRGGRRDSFQKERAINEEAQVLRNPGSVLSAGLEGNPAKVLLPVLVAPKLQQRGQDAQGRPLMQIPQVFAGKSSGKAQFQPALPGARVLYINPYAELPDSVVERVGLQRVPIKPEKDASGALDATALNVPIPDVLADNERIPNLASKYDPAMTPGEYGYRNPTFAEAARTIALEGSTPIKPYTQEMVEEAINGRGRVDYRMAEDGPRLFMVRDKTGRPVGYRTPQNPGQMPRSAAGPMTPWGRATADPVTDFRVGSPMSYTQEAWGMLDDLIGALAEHTYGRINQRPGAARWEVPVEGSRAFTVVPDDPRGKEFAKQLIDYGALVNLPGNAIPEPVVEFQRRLLDEAGIPGGKRHDENQLIRMLSFLRGIADAPPADVPLTPALAAAAAESIVAPEGKTGLARLLQRALTPVVTNERAAASLAQPVSSPGRQNVERSILGELARFLRDPEQFARERTAGGPQYGVFRDALSIPQPRYYQPSLPGTVNLAAQGATALPQSERDTLNYMIQRLGIQPREPEPAYQYVMPGLWNRAKLQAEPDLVGPGFQGPNPSPYADATRRAIAIGDYANPEAQDAAMAYQALMLRARQQAASRQGGSDGFIQLQPMMPGETGERFDGSYSNEAIRRAQVARSASRGQAGVNTPIDPIARDARATVEASPELISQRARARALMQQYGRNFQRLQRGG